VWIKVWWFIPDQVSLGVLVTAVPRDTVDDAVTVCGVGDRRSGGKLPAHVTAYLTMALCLFSEDDYEEAATKVTGTLNRWGAGTPRGREVQLLTFFLVSNHT
jgi:hypothetical protein